MPLPSASRVFFLPSHWSHGAAYALNSYPYSSSTSPSGQAPLSQVTGPFLHIQSPNSSPKVTKHSLPQESLGSHTPFRMTERPLSPRFPGPPVSFRVTNAPPQSDRRTLSVTQPFQPLRAGPLPQRVRDLPPLSVIRPLRFHCPGTPEAPPSGRTFHPAQSQGAFLTPPPKDDRGPKPWKWSGYRPPPGLAPGR